jgi:hypothetical protein
MTPDTSFREEIIERLRAAVWRPGPPCEVIAWPRELSEWRRRQAIEGVKRRLENVEVR